MNITHYFRPVRTLALAAIAAATLAACTDNDDAPGGDDTSLSPGIPVAFSADITPGTDTPDATPASADAPSTRTVLTPDGRDGFTVTWKGKDNYANDCDQILIRATKETVTVLEDGVGIVYVPATSTASSALEPLNNQNQLTLPLEDQWTFTAVYGSNATMGTLPSIDIQSLWQSAPGNTEHIAANDFSVATATQTVTAQSNLPQDISLRFEHKLSALQLHVTNKTGAALTVSEIRLSVDDGQINTRKAWDAAAGDWSATNELKSDYQQLTITAPEALATGEDAQDFHLLLFPGYGGKSLTITVITDLGAYTLTKAAPAAGFAARTNYMTNIGVKNSSLNSDETWTEYIGTKAQLEAFRDKVNGGTDTYEGKTVLLTADIDLSGETWTPIGTSMYKFMGTFDGGGHHISNLNASATKDGAGLFGRVQDATLCNLRVSGNVTSTASYVGGIAGIAFGSGLVENCIFSGTVSGKLNVGGIAGQSLAKIAGCHTKGTITAALNASGGIVGLAQNAVTDCYSEADVTAENSKAGGIAGTNEANGTITRCYATGTVHSQANAGGIIGANSAAVTDCIALNPGTIRTTGTKLTFGRIAGYSGSTVPTCAAWDGMTLTDDATSEPLTGATGIAGEALTTAECLTTAPYTSHGFAASGWAFDDQSSWQSLPWIKAFETIFPDLSPADYRIAVPKHLK